MNNKFVVGFLAVAVMALLSVSFAAVDINLVGGSVSVQQGSSYSEPGYSAFSTVDGDVTGNVAVSNPGTGAVGTFLVGYSVTDSNLDTATAFRSLTVTGGSSVMPYCSGPMAPGWRAGVAGGGCGGTDTTVAAGTEGCPWFFFSGCMVKQK